jgi:alkanesulfonate monooxygenase SsuD/methylene tetrahydromethanopterin reductase-like flavin-dependent oxidoreductase (luciferase family)
MSEGNRPFEIGVFTFGEITADPHTGRPIDPAVRLREFVELAALADHAGLDVFGVGEHHRPDFAIASPPVVLAAIAQATEQIRLTSTVSVLSTADPVKVFEDFTAVDLLSGGRAEITAGRGAYTESFPLFGYDLADYDELFEEKLDLLLRLNSSERVTWSGRHRPPLHDVGVFPRPIQPQLPVWIAVGGTPASVVRAGRHGLPLYLAILGQPERFAALAELYRSTGGDAGHSPNRLRVGVTSHFYVDTTSQGARDTFYPYYSRYIGDNMPSARGQQLPRDAFDAWGSPHGALFVGSPQEIIDKILWEREISATAASWPRSGSAACRSPTPPARSSCSRPRYCRPCVVRLPAHLPSPWLYVADDLPPCRRCARPLT